MSWRVTLACVTAFPLASAAVLGYEEDVEFHAGAAVYRHARVVPVWDRIADDHRQALHWNAGAPPHSGGKYITQWFLFGLDKRVRSEHWLVTGAPRPRSACRAPAAPTESSPGRVHHGRAARPTVS